MQYQTLYLENRPKPYSAQKKTAALVASVLLGSAAIVGVAY